MASVRFHSLPALWLVPTHRVSAATSRSERAAHYVAGGLLAVVVGLHHPLHPFARAQPCEGIIRKEMNTNKNALFSQD